MEKVGSILNTEKCGHLSWSGKQRLEFIPWAAENVGGAPTVLFTEEAPAWSEKSPALLLFLVLL